MLFDSLSYLLFLPTVFIIYWFILKTTRLQNVFLCLASFFFYSCWDYRFLFLLVGSILLNYVSGIFIHRTKEKLRQKWILAIAVTINISLLGFFKYFNFFVESAVDFIQLLGFNPHISTLKVILPVGISFYTFHGLSYIIDIYYKRIQPTTNLIDYSLFVSFFTLLVAGPIERATHLLPQIQKKRTFSYLKGADGLKQILWGLFKKMVIADNCALVVDDTYLHYDSIGSMSLVLGAVLFSIQIYCDFSGYSDIALGSSRLLGFELLKNFNFPYFSRNIAEFWRRWHISLTTWFRDYLYIPLGGSRLGLSKQILNTFIIFLVSGFWHGANWTFLAWGAINALLIIPSIVFKTNRKTLGTIASGKYVPSIKEFSQLILTFSLASLAWIFFRSESIAESYSYITRMFSFVKMGDILHYMGIIRLPNLVLCIAMMLIFEWFSREDEFGLRCLKYLPRWFRYLVYYSLILMIFILKVPAAQQFIYFQF